MDCPLNPSFQSLVCEAAGASSVEVEDVIQELWSGYGQILRLRLEGGRVGSVIAKQIRMESAGRHPRGWNSSLSHERKLKSYQVETTWYRSWSDHCGGEIRIPDFLAFGQEKREILLLLEDLDAAGFPVRLNSVSTAQLRSCLDWLANFHAAFLGTEPEGLWETGTYWHLATRSEELAALDDRRLKEAAPVIDETLSGARFQTIVHGDAKLANFCFPESGDGVAAVDFQYVGGGCGMKDVAYFIGSCLDESECERQEEALLNGYFETFGEALASKHPSVDAAAVESEWRDLFPVAWTDFHRFLKGWSPGHWKIHSYSERLAREVLANL